MKGATVSNSSIRFLSVVCVVVLAGGLRSIEAADAAERFLELASDPEIVDPKVRVLPTAVPTVGRAVVEAPRGTSFRHHETAGTGVITRANLIVATQNKAARALLHSSKAGDEGLLNMVEMAFRAYDPCHGCGTHALPGSMPIKVSVRDAAGNLLREIRS